MSECPYAHDTYIDIDSTDEEVEEFIEREREAFRKEWFEYIAEDDD